MGSDDNITVTVRRGALRGLGLTPIHVRTDGVHAERRGGGGGEVDPDPGGRMTQSARWAAPELCSIFLPPPPRHCGHPHKTRGLHGGKVGC